MRRITKIAAVVVVALVGLTYGVYALEYRGNYDVTVTFVLSQPVLGQPQVTNVAFTSEPTSTLAFWDGLRGHGGGGGITIGYIIAVELSRKTGAIDSTGAEISEVVGFQRMGWQFDDTTTEYDVEMGIGNMPPGEATARIYITSAPMMTIVFDHSYDLVVG